MNDAGIFICIVIYFVPSVVARARMHENVTAIAALNLFLGWTFVGWVAALVWANTNNTYKAAAKPAQTPNFQHFPPAIGETDAEYGARLRRIQGFV